MENAETQASLDTRQDTEWRPANNIHTKMISNMNFTKIGGEPNCSRRNSSFYFLNIRHPPCYSSVSPVRVLSVIETFEKWIFPKGQPLRENDRSSFVAMTTTSWFSRLCSWALSRKSLHKPGISYEWWNVKQNSSYSNYSGNYLW